MMFEIPKRRVMFLSFTFLVKDNQSCRSNVFGKGKTVEGLPDRETIYITLLHFTAVGKRL